MYQLLRLTVITCCIFFSFTATAQPPKAKPAKPAVKTATKPAVVKKTDYEKLKTDIRDLYRKERYKEVIPKATQYLAQFPKDTQVTMQRAVSYVLLKQYSTGFDQVKKFFTNSDTAAKYIAIMAFSAADTALLTAGVICADESIKLAPAGPWGYFVKGGIYSDGNEHEKALGFMELMNSRLRDDNEKALLGLYYAKELAFNKQHEKAVAVIDALDKKFPGDEEILSTYAFIYRYEKNYEKAVEKYDALIKKDPANANYHLWKAGALSAAGKTAECCTETEQLIAKDSGYEFLRYRYKCPAYFAAPSISDIKKAIWAVDFSGNNYDFSVSNIRGNTDDGMEFDWNMTSGDDMNGHISLTKEAMAGAIAQNNRFSAAMKNIVMKDQTTVWVSKAVINALIEKGAAKMDAGYGEEEFTVVANNEDKQDDNAFEDKVTVKGQLKYVNTIHVTNTDGGHQLWILNDAKNPLIVRMQFDWGIQLKSIE